MIGFSFESAGRATAAVATTVDDEAAPDEAEPGTAVAFALAPRRGGDLAETCFANTVTNCGVCRLPDLVVGCVPAPGNAKVQKKEELDAVPRLSEAQ